MNPVTGVYLKSTQDKQDDWNGEKPCVKQYRIEIGRLSPERAEKDQTQVVIHFSISLEQCKHNSGKYSQEKSFSL